MSKKLKTMLYTATAIVVIVAGVIMWMRSNRSDIPEGFASGNGRLEATEIDISTKLPGRIEEVMFDEGDIVEKGQVVARMDTETLEAELREAEAEVNRINASRNYAVAVLEQKNIECALADKEYGRMLELFRREIVSEKQVDVARTESQVAHVACAAAEAKITETEDAIKAAIARTERLKAEIEDSILKAPRSGPVLFRLAEPGEVLPAGGKVLTIIDLSDTYMVVFLPEDLAGKVRLGAEARILLDALPDKPIPAKISFVSPEAQFTPKEVETAEERQKLMFRVKVKVLDNSDHILKSGMRGVAYIKIDGTAAWPENVK